MHTFAFFKLLFTCRNRSRRDDSEDVNERTHLRSSYEKGERGVHFMCVHSWYTILENKEKQNRQLKTLINTNCFYKPDLGNVSKLNITGCAEIENRKKKTKSAPENLAYQMFPEQMMRKGYKNGRYRRQTLRCRSDVFLSHVSTSHCSERTENWKMLIKSKASAKTYYIIDTLDHKVLKNKTNEIRRQPLQL